jgi:uncharacterized protein YcfJ
MDFNAKHRSKKLRDSARFEDCSVCGSNVGVVWAHYNGQDGGKGVATKAHDLLGAYLCAECHRQYDEGKGGKADKRAFFMDAFFNSMVRVAEKLARKELTL